MKFIRLKSRGVVRFAGLVVFACLMFNTSASHAAGPLLPSLGDAAGDTLSPAQESQIGQRIMRELRGSGALLDDRELSQALNEFARGIVAAAPKSRQQFEFFLVRDPSLNAFALPGGFVGVHSGLLIAAQNDSELASVIAHEIGHVTQRHIARMLAQNQQSSLVSLAAVIAAIVAASASDSHAAAGLVALGGSAHEQQMLAFSREAEREADRVGLEIMRDAGFEPADMITFFERMQRATRVYESGAPAYLRTHPLTSERMADIRNRLNGMARRDSQKPTLSFELMRAKLSALAGTDRRAYRDAQLAFEVAAAGASGHQYVAAWYGQAVTALALDDTDGAMYALERAQAPPGGTAAVSHAFLASLRARIALRESGPDAALVSLESSIASHPEADALHLLRMDMLLRLNRAQDAHTLIEARIKSRQDDPELWRLLAVARSDLGQTGLAHWATAERYALLGAWSAAVDQLRLAEQDLNLSTYELSKLDNRREVFQRELSRERANR